MHVNKQLLEKYFKGACTAAEAALVEAYLLQDATPEMDAYLLETWEQTTAETTITTLPATPGEKVVQLYRSWYRIAAAVLILVSISTWLWQWQHGKPEKALALQWDTIYNAGYNLRLVSMPDGSKVWLNTHAAIAYTAAYNNTARELWLQGEAYFEVAKMDARPFRVHTDELVTTALGTAFNIATANRADGSIAISLVTGKVAVSASGFSCVLQPGQMLLYKKGALPAPVTRFNATETLDWKNGKLIFNNTTLEDAFARLQSRYGCRIVMKNEKLAKRKVSGSFTANETLDHILATLQYVHGFSYERLTDSIYRINKR